MTFYIEGINNYPISDLGMVAWFGLKQRGSTVKFFTFKEELPLRRDICVIACIETTRWWFEQMNFDVKENLSYPEPLWGMRKFWQRDIVVCDKRSIKTYRKILNREPYFIKPFNKIKAFDPYIVNNPSTIEDHDVDIIISEKIEIESEYRCFILNNELLGVEYYSGNPRVFPDLRNLDGIIGEMKDKAPIAYSIDLGITTDLRTVLIECNDAWSIAPYGLEPRLYARFLSERWIEILKNNPVK